MEKLFDIDVKLTGCISVEGKNKSVNLVSFTGIASGKYFNGTVLENGIDTQSITENSVTLSARYILEGTDIEGKSCRIFIENNGVVGGKFTPVMITDSKALSRFEDAKLSACVEDIGGGVKVSVFYRGEKDENS